MLILEHLLKIVIGDGVVTIELNDGTRLERSIDRIRHGNDARLVIGATEQVEGFRPDPQLIILLRDAHRARALAEARPNFDLDRLAKLFGRSTERFKRLLRLSYLSPTIVDAIVEGRQPPKVTNRFLQNLDGLPLGWAEQEAMLLG